MIRVDLQLHLEEQKSSSFHKIGTGLIEIIHDPVVIGVFLIAATALVFAWVLDYRSLARQERLQESVHAAVGDSIRFERDLRTNDELRKKRAETERRIASVRTIDQNRYAFVHVMDHAASALVADVWIEELVTLAQDPQTGHVQVQITGFAPNSQTVQNYIELLERSPFIVGASLTSSTSQIINQQEAVRFTIIAWSEIADESYLFTETIRPDGTVTTNLDEESPPTSAPIDSTTAPTDTLVAAAN